MDGLKHILSKIENDALKQAQEIKAAAEAEVQQILSSAEAEAEKKAEAIIKNAEKKSEQAIENAKSSEKLLIKKSILSAKSDIVSSGTAYAIEKICEFDDEKYFAIIYSLISKYAQKGSGMICLSEKDLKRLPEDFEEKVNAALKDGCTLKLSDKSADICGGAILVYGMIEENCSFEALLSEKKSEINDALFAQFSA